jgi:Ras family protein
LFNHKYAVGIHGYILVYSIASRQSFEMIQTLHDKILDFQGVDKVCCVVVGQKCDLNGVRWVDPFTTVVEPMAKIGHSVKSSLKRDKRSRRSCMQISSKRRQRITRISVSISGLRGFPDRRWLSSVPPADVFELLMVEMRKAFNPPPEKKKQGWFASWFGGA